MTIMRRRKQIKKSISLSPLGFREASMGLLKVKPKPNESEMVESKEPGEESYVVVP